MTLAILGTGGHAKSIYDIVKNNKRIYFFDKEINLFNVGNKKFRVKRESELLNSHIRGISKVIVAIGDNKIRKKKFDILKKLNYKIVTLIHPKSHIGYGSKIGEGSVVMQGSLINTDSLIGTNCIINSHSSMLLIRLLVYIILQLYGISALGTIIFEIMSFRLSKVIF